MTAAEENLFRRLLSQCDARNRFTPSIPSEDVRAFEALAFELNYIQQASAQGAYMLTDAGAAARRTLIMQDEQHAREEALQAQVESFLEKIDVLLLGPHYASSLEKFQELARPYGVPVAVIPHQVYGLIDGNALLDQAIELKNKK